MEIETAEANPLIIEMMERIRQMPHAEIVEDIFRHEKEFRGIDWLEFAVDGRAGLERARALAGDYLKNLQKELCVSDEELAELGIKLSSGVQDMPAWAIDHSEADEWRKAKGEKLGEMVAFRLKVMQSLELTSSSVGFAQVGLSIGIVAWTKKAYDAYKVARTTMDATRLAAAVHGIKAVTLAASRLFVATVIVAVIMEVLLFLMEKKAVVYTVLVNMTDENLEMETLAVENGKQLVQFVDPLVAHESKTLNKRTVIDLPDGTREASYWVGLFSASKSDMALIGSLGAYHFKKNSLLPYGAYVGWEIPLTGVFGGPNRCLVSLGNEGSAATFAGKTSSSGSLKSTSRHGKVTATARMHSGSGSEGYMSVVFEQ